MEVAVLAKTQKLESTGAFGEQELFGTGVERSRRRAGAMENKSRETGGCQPSKHLAALLMV